MNAPLRKNKSTQGHVDPKVESQLDVADITYPGKTGAVFAHFAKPRGDVKRPGVIVVHEIWGLVDHIKDVARRIASEGFLVIAPDALSPMGGSPEDVTEARGMIQELDSEANIKNFIAAVKYLKTHPQSTGKVGCTGFCWGGGVTNQLAVNAPDLRAAVPFYGRQPAPEDVAKIKASMLIHYAGLDERINQGIPAFEAALKEAAVDYQMFIYEGAEHAFFNDTGDRYHKDAAILAWERTIAFFKRTLQT